MFRRKFFQLLAGAAVAAHMKLGELVPIPGEVETPTILMDTRMFSVGDLCTVGGTHLIADREVLRVTAVYPDRLEFEFADGRRFKSSL